MEEGLEILGGNKENSKDKNKKKKMIKILSFVRISSSFLFSLVFCIASSPRLQITDSMSGNFSRVSIFIFFLFLNLILCRICVSTFKINQSTFFMGATLILKSDYVAYFFAYIYIYMCVCVCVCVCVH